MAKKSTRKTVRNVPKRADVIELINLRPGNDDDGQLIFKPVGPASLVGDEGLIPVGEVDGNVIMSDEESMRVGATVFPTAGRVRGVIVNRDGSMSVDDGSGNRRLLERNTDGLLTDQGPEPEWNPVMITAKTHSVVEMTIPPMSFEDLPSTGPVTDQTVLQRLSSCLSDAYATAAGVASTRGVFLRPVIARAMVYDNDGAVLYRGPEVLVGTDCLSHYTDSVNLILNSDGRSTEEQKIDLTSYRLAVNVKPMTGQGWVERGARLVIEVSPQFHPRVADSQSRRPGWASVGHSSGQSTQKRLTVAIPGREQALSASYPERSAALIEAVAGGFNRVRRVAARFSRPYERGVDSEITAVPFPRLAEEVSAMNSVMSRPVGEPESSADKWLVQAPNRFSARLYASDGTGTVVAGDVEVTRFRGYSAAELAMRTNPALSYRSITTTVFADGSSVTGIDTGDSNAPTSLSPLLTYPAPDATALRVAVEYPDGSVRRWAYTLHPDQSGSLSLAVDHSLAPTTGSEVDDDAGIDLGASAPVKVRRENMLVVLSTTRPAQPSAVTVAEGRIRGIVGARTNGGAWEFGRSRFVVATDRGMSLAGITNEGTRIVLNHLNDRVIADRMGLTAGGDGRVYAVERGRVLRIDGTRTDEIDAGALRSTDIDSIAFDVTDRCIVAGASDGSTGFHHIDVEETLPTFITPSLGPFNSFGAIGQTIYAATESGLYAFSRADTMPDAETTDVSITVRVESTDCDRALRRIEWPVVMDDFTGVMKITRVFLPTHPHALLGGWSCRGALHTTLRFPIVAPSLRAVCATITGSVGLTSPKRTVIGLPR